MKIVQKTSLVEEVDGKEIQLVFDNDMPLGKLHDALMIFKGFCVDKMLKAHQDQEEEAKQKITEEEEKNGSDSKD